MFSRSEYNINQLNYVIYMVLVSLLSNLYSKCNRESLNLLRKIQYENTNLNYIAIFCCRVKQANLPCRIVHVFVPDEKLEKRDLALLITKKPTPLHGHQHESSDMMLSLATLRASSKGK